MARRAADAVWAARAMKDEWSDFMETWNQQPVLRGAKVRGTSEDWMLKNRRVEISRSFIEWSLGMQRPLWERLSEIQIPVLWVVGEMDENYLQLGKEAVKRIPRGELWVAPAAGHRVPWEAESKFLAVLSGFIQKLRA
jgi:2-succinyl-6-hydroxy-2,4-cyclohexadiene-1-carboxylate synthase